MLESPSSSNTTPEDHLPSPGRGSVTSFSERDSDADLAERHAAAVASATARPMGLMERMDSANYQPRPPAMTERQDSAQNLQAMAEEMAELTAGGAADAAGAAQPLGRQDSAHDMADGDNGVALAPGRGPSLTGVSRQDLPVSPTLARQPPEVAFRRDSASDQPMDDSAGASTSAEALMPRAPSLQAARALMRDTPVGSPQDGTRIGLCPPELEVAPRQDSALDSLVAARHAVLADLAADMAGARPSGSVDAGTPMGHQTSDPLFVLGDLRGNASDVPALDPLVHARALVHPGLASSSSCPISMDGEAMEGSMADSSLEAARIAVLGQRPWSGSRTWAARLGDDVTPAAADMMPSSSSAGLLPLEGQKRAGKEPLGTGSLSANSSLRIEEGMQMLYSTNGGSLDAGLSGWPAVNREAMLRQQFRQQAHLPFLSVGAHGGAIGSSPFEQAVEVGDHSQDSPMHTLEQARRTVTAFMDQDGLTDGGAGAPPLPAARWQLSAEHPDSPMMAGPAGGASAAAFAPEWQQPQAGEAGPSDAAQPGRPMGGPLGIGYDSANELTRPSQ